MNKKNTETALVGSCSTCGKVNAIDLDNTPERRREMEMPGRTIEVMSHDDAVKAWNGAGKCECDKLTRPYDDARNEAWFEQLSKALGTTQLDHAIANIIEMKKACAAAAYWVEQCPFEGSIPHAEHLRKLSQ